MDDASYQRLLRRAYRIEIQGEAAYAAAARTSRDPTSRHKWDVLRRLETETKHRILDALRDEGAPTHEPYWSRWSGYVAGVVAALLPWRATMYVLRGIARHTVAEWQRMERRADGRRPELHAFLVEHERVQHELTDLELTGRAASSLDPVQALLRDAPP